MLIRLVFILHFILNILTKNIQNVTTFLVQIQLIQF